MNTLRKYRLMITGFVTVVVAGVLGLVIASPAQAAGGWGFGMPYTPSVVASCTSYNVIPVKVDVPQGSYAGYVTGRLTNTRTGTVRKPVFGVATVYNAGSPTIGYLIFNPPEGTVDGDVLHVSLTLSSSPALTPVVGSFQFSYRCSTGEVVYTTGPVGTPINSGYGDSLVLVTSGKDSSGSPEVQAWCLDPQGYASTVGLTLSKSTLAGLPAHPSTNTLIEHNNTCSVQVTAYLLTSGEYEITIGPDYAGVVNKVTFTGLTPTGVHFLKYNLNQGM